VKTLQFSIVDQETLPQHEHHFENNNNHKKLYADKVFDTLIAGKNVLNIEDSKGK